MRKLLLVGGAALGLMLASYAAHVESSKAGWGPPFACGSGTQTGKVGWDQGESTPGDKESKPVVVVTGISKSAAEADKPAAEETEKVWTTEELKAGKPMLVYYFINIPTQGTENATNVQDENYKFSRKFEMGVLQEKNIDRLNSAWRKKKVEIDVDADRSKEKNQAHIEFWSFTGKKLGDVTLKEQNQLNAGPFGALLVKYEKMNRDLCNAEIKRLDAAKALREKDEANLGK